MTEPPRTAAVLVPVFRDAAGTLRLVLVVRSDHGMHGGQLGLPGGQADPGDATPLATALREAEEEIGLEPAGVEVLAELEPVESGPSRFRVHPFLARVSAATSWRLSADEIVEVLTPSVDDLARGARSELLFRSGSWPEGRLVDGIAVGDRVLWGMTLRLLDRLLPRLQAGEWPL